MPSWADRKVLVTGGASFIGSHLVDRLVALGARTRVADDVSSGRLQNLSASIRDVEFMQGDLRDPHFAAKACAGIEVVFHLAASHGGRGYIDSHPVECSTNLVLDGTVFAAAHRAGAERLCFASSACVYPTTLQARRSASEAVFLREDMANTFEPGKASPDLEYGWAKLMGEMVLQAYTRQHGMKTVSCRLFTAYGERENETHAVVAWIARAFIQQDPFVIWGTGQQDRNFTYVGDIAEGMLRAAERISDGSPVNLGSAEHIRVVDAVKLVLKMTNHAPLLTFDESKPTGVFTRAADLARARELLDWEPQTTFEQGLARTIDWYFSTHDQAYVRSNIERLLTER